MRVLCLAAVMGVVLVSHGFSSEPAAVQPLPRAHAHNDYEHSRPLLDALSHGFTSVEADIYLVDGKLLVAHNRADVQPDRTLESLYLDPLRERVRQHGGSVYPGGPPFSLLIDIKSEAEATYAALRTVLGRYKELFTPADQGQARKSAVTVVISGNRPEATMAAESQRYAGIDGRLSDLSSDRSAELMPWISDNWLLHFTWKGEGQFSEKERDKLRSIVHRAHQSGRRVRFWATPDSEAVWRELVAADVDLVNTDNLTGLAAFLRQSAQPGTGARGSPRVERFAVHEIVLSATGNYGNPYTELTAEAVITPPSGGAARKAFAFWDGGSSWKLRFSPDVVGAWKWSVKSADPGLDGRSGMFECVASARPGSIRPMRQYPLHFERQDGSPFWFLGDTAWALYTDSEQEKHGRDQALAYIDARASQGFNVLHSMLLSEAGWGNRGGQPFADIQAETLNPAYWQEVDFRLKHANAKKIVCGLALAWGAKGRNEPLAWGRFRDLEARKRYARYIAARYSAFDTYFLVSGEWHGEVRTRKADTDAVRKEFVEIGDALAAADPHDRMIGIHPMTAEGSVREYKAARWMSFNDYQQNYRDLHGRILQSRALENSSSPTPIGPVVNSEYGYFLRDQSGDGVPDKDNSTSLAAMRHATWDIVMAGGYVVTGFGTTYFGGNRDPGPFDLHVEKNKAWEAQVGRTKSLFSELQWWKLVPHDELLACESPRGTEGKEFNQVAPPKTTYWCLAEPGQNYVVYIRGLTTPLQLKLGSGAGPMQLTQFNARTGEKAGPQPVAAEAQLTIQPPDDQDWVFLLTQAKLK